MQRQQRSAEAEASFKKCVECNNPVFAARARLNLADIAVQQKNYEHAEQIYRQIVNGSGPVADRAAVEQAMWKLGCLLFDRHQFEESALQFSELLHQYPAHPQALSARELLGECYRERAKQALDMAKSEAAISSGKTQFYQQQWRQNLESALHGYDQLAEILQARARVGKSSSAEEALLRKSLFVVADCYYDLPNYLDVAYQKYQNLFQRYNKESDGLWACQRLYGCFYCASLTQHTKLLDMREAAEDAVETCLRQFPDYVEAQVFRTDNDRVLWQQWLNKAYEELKKSKQRSGGEQG
jgi:hypothetical protein